MADRDFMNALSQKLAVIRARKLATQIELERVSGVNQSTISRILNGHRKRVSPSILALEKYATMLLSDPELPRSVKSAALEFLAHGNEEELLATIQLGSRLLAQRTRFISSDV